MCRPALELSRALVSDSDNSHVVNALLSAVPDTPARGSLGRGSFVLSLPCWSATTAPSGNAHARRRESSTLGHLAGSSPHIWHAYWVKNPVGLLALDTNPLLTLTFAMLVHKKRNEPTKHRGKSRQPEHRA